MPPTSFDYRRKAWITLSGKFGRAYLFTLLFALIGTLASAGSLVLYNVSGWAEFRNEALANYFYNPDSAEYFQLLIESHTAYFTSGVFWLRNLITVAGFVAGFFFMLAYFWVFLETANGKKAAAGGYFAKLKLALTSFWLALLIFGKAFLWGLLLIIPGIVKLLSYSMAFFIKLENPDKPALECIAESVRLTEGNKAGLFILMFSFLGWWILAFVFSFILSLVLGLFVPFAVGQYIAPFIQTATLSLVTVYSMTAFALFYRNLKGDEIFPKQKITVHAVPPNMFGYGAPPPRGGMGGSPYGNPYNNNPYANPYGIPLPGEGHPPNKPPEEDNPFDIPLPPPSD